MNSASSIPLGDFLQKAALTSYQEIRDVVDTFAAQTPLVRAERLDAAVKRAKKRFAQIYAILNWISEPHVQKYIASTTSLLSDVREHTDRLNMKQDILYFTHANLYGRRVRSIDVSAAANILKHSGVYDSLPVSIFTCREPPPPPEIDDAAVSRSLDVLIRTKLVLEEPVPTDYHLAVIDDGFLVLTCAHLFRVTLSLTSMDEPSAPWTVIDVEILVHHHPREMLELEMRADELNGKLRDPLDRLLSAPSPELPLARLYRACRHAAVGACLRLLYVQALDMVRSTWYGHAETVYSDTVDASTVRVQFWAQSTGATEAMHTSEVTDSVEKKFLYELVITQPRRPTPGVSYNTADCSIVAPALIASVRSVPLQNVSKIGTAASDPIHFGPSDHETMLEPSFVEDCIALEGVFCSRLFQRSLHMCSTGRLEYLVGLVRSSADSFNLATTKGLQMRISEEGPQLILSVGAVQVALTVSSLTGVVGVYSVGLCSILGVEAGSCCENLREEANEALLGVDIFDYDIRRAPPLVSLAGVLSSMFFADWVQTLSVTLKQRPNIVLFPQLQPLGSESTGVLFQYSSWMDLGICCPSQSGDESPCKRQRISGQSQGSFVDGSVRQLTVFLSVYMSEPSSMQVHCDLLLCEAEGAALEPTLLSTPHTAMSFRLPKIRYAHPLDLGEYAGPSGCVSSVCTEIMRSWRIQSKQFMLEMSMQFAVDAVACVDGSAYHTSQSSIGVYRCYNVRCSDGSAYSFAGKNTANEVTLLMLPDGPSTECTEVSFMSRTDEAGTALCLPMLGRDGGAGCEKVDLCVTSTRDVFVRARLGSFHGNTNAQPPVGAALAVLLQIMHSWDYMLQKLVTTGVLSSAVEEMIVVPLGSGCCVAKSTALYHEVSLSVTDGRTIKSEERRNAASSFSQAVSVIPVPLLEVVLVPSCLQICPSSGHLLTSPLRLASVKWTWANHLNDTMLEFTEAVCRNSLDEALYIRGEVENPTELESALVHAVFSRVLPFVSFACLLSSYLHCNGLSNQLPDVCTSAYLWDTGRATFDLALPAPVASSDSGSGSTFCNGQTTADTNKSRRHQEVRLIVEIAQLASADDQEKKKALLTVESDGRRVGVGCSSGATRLPLRCSVDMGSFESTSNFQAELKVWIDSLLALNAKRVHSV